MLLDLRYASKGWIWAFIISILNSYRLLTFLLQTSNTRNKMIEVLATTGYLTQEFILSPLQFGVPYSRPRYFCLVPFYSLLFSLFLLSIFLNQAWGHTLMHMFTLSIGKEKRTNIMNCGPVGSLFQRALSSLFACENTGIDIMCANL